MIARLRTSLGGSVVAISAGAVWSLGTILIRKAKGVDAFQYLIWRSIAVVIVIELIAIIRRKPIVTPRAFTSGRVVLIANIGLLVASLGFVYAVTVIPLANAAFLTALSPIVASVFGALVLHERITRMAAVCLIGSTIGVAIMAIGDVSLDNLVGNLAAFSASLGFGVYTVAVRSDPQADWSPVLPGYAVMMIAACVAITVSHDKPVVPEFGDISKALVHGGVLIVAGTLMFNFATKHLTAGAAAIGAQSENLLVPIWGLAFLGDRPPATTYVGGAIILGSVVAQTLYDDRVRRLNARLDAPTHAL